MTSQEQKAATLGWDRLDAAVCRPASVPSAAVPRAFSVGRARC
jgi:hypothetical protein